MTLAYFLCIYLNLTSLTMIIVMASISQVLVVLVPVGSKNVSQIGMARLQPLGALGQK